MRDRSPSAQEQFGRQAHLYSVSQVHSSGESLEVLTEWAARGRYKLAVDVATGAGFTAFAVAPYAEDALATDLTPAMLGEARRIAQERNLSNVSYALAAAEDLPFADGSLDLLTCRTAAHHFQDVERALATWCRVLRPDGVLLLADTTSPEDPETARWMHDIEVRRDPSHVRNLSSSQWLSLLEQHGFQVTDAAMTPVDLEFDDWVRRSGTLAQEVERLRSDFLKAPAGAAASFNIQTVEGGSIRFNWDCLVVRAIREA